MSIRNPMADQVAFVGVGTSAYGRDRQMSASGLVLEACTRAIRDAGLTAADIDGLVTSSVLPFHVAPALGIPEITYFTAETPPFINHVVAAMNAVAAGAADTVLVVHHAYRPGMWSRSAGGDPLRMRAGLGQGNGTALMGTGHLDHEPWSVFGGTGYAAWASRYFYEYPNTSREDLGLIAINNRTNALHNENAVMRTPLSMEDYLSARMVREPLCLLDMDVPIDGADAFVLTTAERARDLPNRPVLIHAATLAMASQPSEHLQVSLNESGQNVVVPTLFAKSDLALKDMDVYFPYDGFSIICLNWIENVGYCGRGEGGDFLRQHWNSEQNRVLINGKVPLNTHGGSLSEGGTQGSGHVREAVMQLQGRCGTRQVPGAVNALLTPGGFFFNAQGLVLRTV